MRGEVLYCTEVGCRAIAGVGLTVCARHASPWVLAIAAETQARRANALEDEIRALDVIIRYKDRTIEDMKAELLLPVEEQWERMGPRRRAEFAAAVARLAARDRRRARAARKEGRG